jgi:hypothetical protein
MLKENIYNFRTIAYLNWQFALHICQMWAICRASCFYSTHTVILKLIQMPVLQNQKNALSLDITLLPQH